jgi:flagella basal body P-ring formation protein FlgA
MLGTRNTACLVLAIALGVGGHIASAAANTTVTLRSSVSLSESGVEGGAGGPVTLAQVADISGDDAARLGALVLADSPAGLPRASEGVARLDSGTIRRVLEGAKVNWGRLTLNAGAGDCLVRFASPRVVVPDRAAKPEQKQAFEVVDTSVQGSGEGSTIRVAIARRLAEHMSVDADDLRLLFADEDGPVLDQVVGSRRLEIEPVAGPNSSRTPVRVFMYEGDRVVLSKSLDIQAQVRRTVAVATSNISRGDAVTTESTSTEERWVAPGAKVAAEAVMGGGMLAAQRINAGQIVTEDAVEAPLAVKRGDVVWVHCLSGSVTVKAKTRAMQAARDGEEVLLRFEGTKDTIRARMSGPGRAVMLVDDSATTPTNQPSAEPVQSSQPQRDAGRDGRTRARASRP